MLILHLNITLCLHRIRHKHCDSTHVSLWIWSTTICRWSHIKRGSSMWHYLMFCSINDSAIQLESALNRCHHRLRNTCMSVHGSLSSKVKCQMLRVYTYGEGPGTHRWGLGGPASQLVTEKRHYWGRWSAVVVTSVPWQQHNLLFIYMISN